MEEKNWVNDESKEKDYFEEEEERRMQEELDAILKSTNPLNKDEKLTEEELESFYSITTRRKKNKNNIQKEKIIRTTILGLGVIIGIGIIWSIFSSIFTNDKITSQDINQRIEVLNEEIIILKEKNDSLISKNQELQSEIERLKSQSEESSIQSNPISDESPKEESLNESETYYTVQKGDTLWKISTKFYGTGKYYEYIMKYNNLKSENDLKQGMKLEIPKL